MFEAARWAPSAYNFQPWRFVYAWRETPAFQRLLSHLVAPGGLGAESLGPDLRYLRDPGGGESELVAARSQSFDAGATWALLALHARRLGYAAHGMIRSTQAKPEVKLRSMESLMPRQGPPYRRSQTTSGAIRPSRANLGDLPRTARASYPAP